MTSHREGARPGVLATFVGALAFALASCGGEPASSRALLELERMAFLPDGAISLAVLDGATSVEPSVEQRSMGADQALLVDMYEVTRGEWRAFLANRRGSVDPTLAAAVRAWKDGTDSWPASFMTQAEAAEFAAWRGMRLLTAGEWVYCAMGPNRWAYPWGTTWQESVANTLELRLERPTPVGTFESGRSTIGCYDLLGNVAEWVSDAAPSRDARPGDAHVSAMGGSFRQHVRAVDRPIYQRRDRGFLALALHPASRSDQVGLRCAAEAADYLWTHASQWGEGEAVRKRLFALGRRWGRRALPVLMELAARPGAPRGLRDLVEGARQ